jgi:hypothetical protein
LIRTSANSIRQAAMAKQFKRSAHLLKLMGLRSPAPLASRLRHAKAKGLIPLYDPSELIW